MSLSLHSHFSEEDLALNSSGMNKTTCSEVNAQSCHRTLVVSLRKCLRHQSFTLKNLFPNSTVHFVSARYRHWNPSQKLVDLGVILVKELVDLFSVKKIVALLHCHEFEKTNSENQYLNI